MKFNFLIAIAILTCFLIAAMAFVMVTARSDQPALNPGQATLSGLFTDKDYLGVPGVAVTLYEVEPDNSTGEHTNLKAADVPGNPQTTNADTNLSAIGVYMFTNVRPGTYNVTGLKDGYLWSGIVDVSESGTTTFNVHSNDYASVVSTTPVVPADGNGITVTGTISGMVVDKNKNGIPNATVTLYETRWNETTCENVKPVDHPQNPQLTVSDPMVACIGTYTYYDVPLGTYNLTAEKDGHMWFACVNASSPGTHTNNIAIPDYKLPPEGLSPTPVAAASTVASAAPSTPWFTISGFVTDKNKNGIPGVKVTLYQAVANSSSGGLDNVKLASVENNPQMTNSDPTVAALGTYTYYNVPEGLYNVTAEKADSAGNVHVWFSRVNGTSGTQTINVALPDYVIPA